MNNIVESPRYRTEAEVTRALAAGEISGLRANEAYALARRWQRYLKDKRRKPHGARAFAPKEAAASDRRGKYLHVWFRERA